MSGEVWYPVGPKDVFPETFAPVPARQPGGARGLHGAPRRPARRRPSGKATRSASSPATCMMCSPTRRTSASSCGARPQPPPCRRCHRCLILAKEPPMADSIVIVSAARTPIGGLLGDFSGLAAHQLGARRHQGRGRARRRHRRRRRRGADGQLPDGRPGPGAGAPGGARRRPAAVGRRGDAVEDVRLGHARHDVRARHAAGRERRGRRRRRHGEHDQRAAPDLRAQGRALRPGAAATTTWRSTASRTPTSAAARWACSPRSASPSTSSAARRWTEFAIASTERAKKANEDGSFDWEIAPVDACRARAATTRRQARRAAVQGQARQDRRPEAGVQEGRHDHRRHLVEHLRRRRRAGADARVDRAAALGCKPIARIVAPRGARAGAEPVHHRAGRRDPEGAGQGRLEGRRRRPVGGQRGLRRGDDGGDDRVQAAARDRQRARRRGRARPPDRRQRRAHRRHAARRAAQARQEEGVAALCIGGGEATAMAVELL